MSIRMDVVKDLEKQLTNLRSKITFLLSNIVRMRGPNNQRNMTSEVHSTEPDQPYQQETLGTLAGKTTVSIIRNTVLTESPIESYSTADGSSADSTTEPHGINSDQNADILTLNVSDNINSETFMSDKNYSCVRETKSINIANNCNDNASNDGIVAGNSCKFPQDNSDSGECNSISSDEESEHNHLNTQDGSESSENDDISSSDEERDTTDDNQNIVEDGFRTPQYKPLNITPIERKYRVEGDLRMAVLLTEARKRLWRSTTEI